jgi:hypothetical protein
VEELRQPGFDVVVVPGEPLVGQVHLHQVAVHLVAAFVEPLDRRAVSGIGVAAIADRGTDAGHHKTDVVVVVQGADGDTREGGYRTDGLGVHAATIDPDVA